MRVATLQFAPKLGLVEENVARADSLLSSHLASTDDLDMLVLPELAFTGYNHPSLPSISPYLEPTAAGLSTQWAIGTARRLQCLVSVGYPELYSRNAPALETLRPTMIDLGPHKDTYYSLTAYNSTVTVDPEGQVVAHYRKTHLYYTDELWAQESPQGFTDMDMEFPIRKPKPLAPQASTKKRTTFAICMDLNSRHFLDYPDSHPLCTHVLTSSTSLLVLTTAWLTHLGSESLLGEPGKPDLDTLSYWFERLGPLIDQPDKEVTCIFANRCGEEAGKAHPGQVDPGDGVRYAGSSLVCKVGKGNVFLGGVMGRAEEGVLVVGTHRMEDSGWKVRFRRKDEVE